MASSSNISILIRFSVQVFAPVLKYIEVFTVLDYNSEVKGQETKIVYIVVTIQSIVESHSKVSSYDTHLVSLFKKVITESLNLIYGYLFSYWMLLWLKVSIAGR